MSEQQPHTPTMYDIRYQFVEAWAGDFVFGKADAAKYFDRALEAHNARIRAAAEQRGAVKALRDAADYLAENKQVVIDGDEYTACNSCTVIQYEHLTYRADRLEGDDE